MTVRRLFIFMLLPIMMLLLWSAPVSADDKPIKVINPEGGECKIDDSYKRYLAQQAYTALYDTLKAFEAYVKIMENDYKAEGGVCHHIYNWWSHAKMSLGADDLEDAYELTWTDYDKAGAEVVDSGQYKDMSGKVKCSEMMGKITSKQDITDVNIHKIREKAQSANSGISNLISWAQGAKPGSYLEVPSGINICEIQGIGCASGLISQNDCDYLYVEANGEIICSDRYGFSIPQEDGKCYNMNYGVKAEKPCYKKVGVKFPSASDFEKKVSQADKCLAKMLEAEELRGSKGKDGGFIGNRRVAENALSILGGADTECKCEKDENGNPTDKIDPEKGCQSKQETVEDNLEYTCPTVGQYQAEFGEVCLTCGLMANILGAGQKISQQAFEAISGDLIKLLEVAFLIFIAYTVLLAVASPEPQKLSKLLTSLLTQGTKVAIAILILLNPEYLYGKVINPILDGAVDFGLAFSNVSAPKEGENGGIKEMDESFGEQIRVAGAEYTQYFIPQGDFLSTPTLEKMVGANKNFSKEAAFMPALGRCLICHATHNLPSGAPHFQIIPRVKMLITGAILLIFGLMIWLAIGFYILDCCLQLCLIVAMMSFFVACWPFKLTNAYVKVGWNMFLNIFFNFVMMSVIIVTIALLTGQAVQRLGMTEEVNNNNVDQIEKNLELIGLGIIVMVVVCLICLKLSRESGRLANKFAGGAQIKMGGDLGGMAAGAVTQGGKSGFKTTWKALGKTGGSIAEASGLKGAASAAKQGIKETFGGGTKSKGASFKQNDAADKGGGDKGNKEGGENKGGKEGNGENGGKESGGNE